MSERGNPPDTAAAPSDGGLAPQGHFDRVLWWGIEEGRFGFVLLSVEGRILHANGAAREILRCDQPKGEALAELLHPDDRGWSGSELTLLYAGVVSRVRHQVRLLTGDGTEMWVELNVRRVDDAPDPAVAAVAMFESAGDRVAWEQELRRLADSDPLTEVFNRRRFLVEFERHLAVAKRYGAGGALLLLDIDRLKQINDTHGHLAGDRVIITTAELLSVRARASDVVARLGGDEFAMLLPAASEDDSIAVADELLNRLRGTPAAELPGPFTVSIGVASVSGSTDAETLLERADSAMYLAKRAGGDGYATHVPVTDRTSTPRSITAVGRRAASSPEVDELTLLQTIAELGSASPGLAAWELSTNEQAITLSWTRALNEHLVQRAGFDASDKEWHYELTAAGHSRLRELELPEDQSEEGFGSAPHG